MTGLRLEEAVQEDCMPRGFVTGDDYSLTRRAIRPSYM